jgi:hypothetical protein
MHNFEHSINNVIHSLTNLEGVIISSWESMLRSTLTPDKQTSKPILIDHLPEILENLRYVLESEEHGDEEIFGLAHGQQRAYLTNFDLMDLMNEYSILRQVLIFNLYPFGSIEGALRLHMYLDNLCAYAIKEFCNREITSLPH